MDDKWAHNKKRFLDKINVTDANFCTSDPKSIGLDNKFNIKYIPNPVDESFEVLRNYQNKVAILFLFRKYQPFFFISFLNSFSIFLFIFSCFAIFA